MFHKRIRAWHKTDKKMYKVITMNFEEEKLELDAFIGQKYKYAEDCIIANFKDVIIMQESGLQDDKEFNVFEGDLIKFEGELFILNYGHYGEATTKVNGYGWYLYGKEFTFLYVGGGEKVGTFFENPELVEA